MHRFYASESGICGGKAFLSDEDSHHAINVLRLQAGNQVELLSSGRRFSAAVSSVNSGKVELDVLEELPSTEARLRITLYQGLPKAEKMEMILQKAVELGADTVVPVMMSRCVVRLDPADQAKKTARWQKIAREACKQSGRCSMMNVEKPLKLQQACEDMKHLDKVIVPWEEEHNASLSAFYGENKRITTLGIVIGPEGGISSEEIAALKQTAGAVPVTLGRRILRTETAGMCAMSALFCLYGDME